ncbi:hypothetical protein HRbin21_01522 [bacterium HR21]|jgi:hypothetical protein|nr:hypothetical protein HRbin21_01522 [bacterium HR21]
MRGWKLLQWVGAFIAVSVLALWLVHGANIFTKDRQMRVYREADPIFGTQREHVVWEPGIWIGLDLAGPLAAAGIGAWLVGWWRQRRQR